MSPLRVIAWSLLAVGPSLAQSPGNVVLIVADDVGVYELPCYGEGTDPAFTPVIDSLAASGVLFRNCWGNMYCSPTRATIQTGRYGVQTGIGSLVGPPFGLRDEEVTIAEYLHQVDPPYANGFFGKWHLSSSPIGAIQTPNENGYDHAVWTAHNLVQPTNDYYRWWWIVDGVNVQKVGYITVDTVDQALAYIATAPEPWFVVLAFHAAHDPFHKPPDGLYTTDVTQATPEYKRPLFKAMIEAMDHEIGRFLVELEGLRETADVVLVGDNGSPNGVIGAPGENLKAKGTIYEGGINVPLIITGPSVTAPGTECTALVNTTDLFQTIAELAGHPVKEQLYEELDLSSISLVPYLSDPTQNSLRELAYSEFFFPAGFAATEYQGSMRDRRFKVVLQYPPVSVLMYDLAADPFEGQNLIGTPLTPASLAAFYKLTEALLLELAGYGS